MQILTAEGKFIILQRLVIRNKIFILIYVYFQFSDKNLLYYSSLVLIFTSFVLPASAAMSKWLHLWFESDVGNQVISALVHSVVPVVEECQLDLDWLLVLLLRSLTVSVLKVRKVFVFGCSVLLCFLVGITDTPVLLLNFFFPVWNSVVVGLIVFIISSVSLLNNFFLDEVFRRLCYVMWYL